MTPQVATWRRWAAWEARTLAGRSPAVFLPVARRRYREGNFQIPFQEDKHLVLEAFPRSGLTFAFTAFEMAQRSTVRVAHHTHVPAQVIAGVRAGVPALVLIRHPDDVVLSLLVRLPELTMRQALRGYLRFYEPLRPHRDRIVFGRFEDVTTDLGAVIRRVNERFGTTFDEFEHSEENVARVMEIIEKGDRREFGEGSALERKIGRPSEQRDRLKEALRTAYHSSSLRTLRERAQAIHEQVLGR